MKFPSTMLVWITCMAIHASPAMAAWPGDPAANVPVDALGGSNPEIVPDGAGGVFVAWTGGQSGTSMVLAQHFDSSALPLWSINGVLVAPSGAPGQTSPRILSDGSGGLFVTWVGHSPGTWDDVYAQRLNSAGDRLWGAQGAAVRVASGNQDYPVLCTDDAGGVIVAWGGLPGVSAQRLDGAGVAQWASGGVTLNANSYSIPTLIADGAGGAITTWAASEDIVVQRIDAAGLPVWGANGVAVCSAPGVQSEPIVVTDGSGGVIVAWVDRRGGFNWADFDDIYAQRIDPSGLPQWTPGGVGVCTSARWQGNFSMTEDGVGGAILAWNDHRDDSTHVYSQRLDGAGAGLWGANGLGLFSTNSAQIMPVVARDGSGGAFLAWMDHRLGEFQTYGQHVASGGEQLWGAGGLALSTATGRQDHQRIAWDGDSAAVVVWSDYRDSNDSLWTIKVYAQGVQAHGLGENPVAGVSPTASTSFALAHAGANPSRGGGLRVRFSLNGDAAASIEVLDVTGRRVSSRSLESFGAGTHSLSLEENQLPPGVYLVKLREGSSVRTMRCVRLD